MNKQINYKNNKNRKDVMEHFKKQENNKDKVTVEDVKELINKMREDFYVVLADDDNFIFYYNFMPFTVLDHIVPKEYLLARINSLVKSGKIKVPKDINE